MKAQITYHEENGYFYPNLALPEQTHFPIGKYGDLHLSYLKVHKKATYVTLLTTCKLNEHLHEVDEQAHEMVRDIVARLAAERGVNEELKAKDTADTKVSNFVSGISRDKSIHLRQL